MASKQVFDRKLQQLDELRAAPQSAETVAALRKALRDKANLVVAKAAKLAQDFDLRDLIPDLLAAFSRLFEELPKSDPQCWGKNAIAQALKDFAYTEPEPFLRGIGHVQHEPVWGGQEDTAGKLRGICMLALLDCRSISDHVLLSHLTDLLADSDPGVRADTARAMAHTGRLEAALLLRLKIACGDEKPEVTGACLSSLLAMDPRTGVQAAQRLLASGNEDLKYEAAAALGSSKEEAAINLLRGTYQTSRDPHFRLALLRAIGASLHPAGLAYLVSLINPADSATARWAIEALAPAKYREELRAQVEAAVRATESETLLTFYRRHFESS